jgi:hypothetical protein
MNVGIVVEGPSDQAAYRKLLPRIRGDINEFQIRECGGKSRLKHGFVNFLEQFQRNPAWQINMALVIRDSDCAPPQPIEANLGNVLSTAGFKREFRVEFFAIPCMLESWLLSDLGAVRTVASKRGNGVPIVPLNIQIANTNSSNDKDVFAAVLLHFGLSPTPPVYGEIAAVADLALIGNRCNYFREFTRRLNAT